MVGTLWVISAPSGAGKTSLVNAVLDRVKDIQVSISHTTRQPRPNEKDGVHYHFVEETEFLSIKDNEGFLEWAKVFDYYYGTSRDWVSSKLAEQKDVILEIDWQGAKQVRNEFKDARSIFILPPSIRALRERLERRAQDNEVVINRRLLEASREIAQADHYDYWILNDEFELALLQLKSIFIAWRQRKASMQHRDPGLLEHLLAGFSDSLVSTDPTKGEIGDDE